MNVTSCKRSDENMFKRSSVAVPVISNRKTPPVYLSKHHQQRQQYNPDNFRPLFSPMEDGNMNARRIVDPQYPFDLKRMLMCSFFGASHDAPARSCHCCVNARRNMVKKTIIVPAISNKMSDIPRDAYYWRKYGQKPIKNSHHPRGYYKCSLSKECAAKKWVERCSDDPTKLRITYQNNHNHPNII